MTPSSHNADVTGVHLVGSVPLPDTQTVFEQCCRQLPRRLRRIPDGETGKRNYFTYWQFACFDAAPQLVNQFVMNVAGSHKEISADQVDQGIAQLDKAGIKTGYDDAAIESYAVFKKLKDEGKIPKHVKFQVALPTPANVVIVLHHAARAKAFTVYEKALFKAMRRIQDEIPADELSIQIDLAVDTALWEGVYEKWWGEGDPKEGTVQYILRMIEQVDQGVEMGLHNCYGDMEHKHWMEPTSLSAVTDRFLALQPRSSHPFAYFHCPVPVSAMSFLPKYFEPLPELYAALQKADCELILGLVHYDDLEGTKQRIQAAKDKVPGIKFGVATECGMGRTPAEQVESILEISKEVTGEVA